MILDHLAVAGETLAEAVAHAEEALGIALGSGGQHPRYGTHNRLIGLEGGLYLLGNFQWRPDAARDRGLPGRQPCEG